MTLLTRIRGPRDLDTLSPEQLVKLAAEIRTFLVDAVSKTGGHLGPNLGVVELTIALHRVFDSPSDRILWDTGHQSYVHKLLTGRQDFSRLKMKGGLSGYPSQAESDHDVIENSHASTVLGWADGIAKANEVLGKDDHVVAVIGDGALTGGMAWEALNNIAAAKDRPLVIVVNDNERSYAPTIGGLANHLATLRTTDGYERFLARGKDLLGRTPVVGKPLYETLHGAKKGLKDFIAPQGMFEDLGLKYVGPIDGHDLEALESALARAKRFNGPVIIHCLTEKGRGYQPALQDEADRFHAVGKIHPDTGLPIASSGLDWTSVFGEEMVKLGEERPDVVAITAAMLQPVGLEKFAKAFPDRVYDVGIAEQHGAASAAGLATGGVHPVFAVYATFLNRAFDQVLMDVALHRCGVTFVLDRAGITGTDGASHNGMWDMSILQVVPGLRIAAPRDADQVRAQLREAVSVDDAPTVVRFSKGAVGPAVKAVGRIGGMDVLREPGTDTPDVLLVSVGALAPMCLEIAGLLDQQGISTTVVDPRWVKPVDEALVPLADRHRVVVTVEDGIRTGGVGAAVAQALRDANVDVPLRDFGIPPRFLDHASRAELLTEIGLTAPDIARQVTGLVSRLDGRFDESAETESAEPVRD
ncbi:MULTISPECIES: 1-deoxy-D-xylulose-5-phosphate synthase [Streptomyces]|uniref:1-deoxy-D-xylulose-5-phosphate synthase n=1 Tax=Streptomyces tsukubensis (strain DSM 42081 / NBRC 108919 / NRRL 18488 / 9993) TaxID=1114943 RepID=I2N8G0_STRT9|nr:1-deoxy-D-xylulose-5-phosphate synthase [Streptomyces tsukubensis]MYS62848.1 1-deoxy-D-xylulose-5-phosphate synthase [Streptomyces sp. SID5473]AZK97187.1 1-deoxy-D-xylulose-5-phosphate synthase [Streptomyces tsukubensis]EIF93307.1 1-deoxy-D-xylulose-5-phosphate synthase [Streptomyces tsukubensis NRRL18488]QKM66845.1 1-deoxy-D-xylulose-5-phosphate synthase [Streptomyces tsukubensis NRRL18488]TAI44807.1 1-deoxy-D-xylulose-5-phosphate synthase [Streptomyces tsukubensis]